MYDYLVYMVKMFQLDKILFDSFMDARDFIIAKNVYEVLCGQITFEQCIISCEVLNMMQLSSEVAEEIYCLK